MVQYLQFRILEFPLIYGTLMGYNMYIYKWITGMKRPISSINLWKFKIDIEH
jgi:hypothetical protein